MRILLIPAMLLALPGCSNIPGTEAKIKQVQDQALFYCRFLPTVSTVAAILSKSPIVNTASSIGSQICDAVTTLPLADGPGDRLPRVNGVVVRGKFVG